MLNIDKLWQNLLKRRPDLVEKYPQYAKTAAEVPIEKKPPTYFHKGFKGAHKRLVNKAIKHNSKGKEFHVMLTYKKEDGTESTRKVTPYTTRKDVFIGKDHSRDGQLRSFKLERIVKMEKTAFEVGFEKQAAARSEILGSLVSAPLSLPAAGLGIAMGPYTAEEQKEVNKKSLSNLIPGVGAYRYGRRTAGSGLTESERPNI